MYILQLSLFYPVTPTTVVCCILMQILCVVSQKSLIFWGTSSSDPQSSFMSPNNPVRSTPLPAAVRVSKTELSNDSVVWRSGSVVCRMNEVTQR